MDSKKLSKIRSELDVLWQKSASLKPRDLAAFANRLGRRESRQTGSHRIFVNDAFPESRPIAIPDHAKPPTLKRFTAEAILEKFEEDYQRLLGSTESE